MTDAEARVSDRDRAAFGRQVAALVAEENDDEARRSGGQPFAGASTGVAPYKALHRFASGGR